MVRDLAELGIDDVTLQLGQHKVLGLIALVTVH